MNNRDERLRTGFISRRDASGWRQGFCTATVMAYFAVQ